MDAITIRAIIELINDRIKELQNALTDATNVGQINLTIRIEEQQRTKLILQHKLLDALDTK